MASLYARPLSPYWWIKKTVKGKTIRESLKLRCDSPRETKKARSQCALETSKELGTESGQKTEQWDAWVTKFLDTHSQHDLTLKGYLQSWSWVRSYLAEIGIHSPRTLNYTHAFGFIDWREKTGVGRSTALRDIKVLRLIMRHAVRTGLASGNPCDRLGVERPAAKIKSEFTDEQIRTVYDHIEKERPWMKLAFMICLMTGCRIGEADLERIDVDNARKTITFRNPKGGTKRAFTTILRADLENAILEARKKHDIANLIPPKTASQFFTKFFRKIGLKGHSIHCTRVTFISRLARSGVPERVARLAVNHASATVHQTYQRLGLDDVRQIEDKLHFPLPQSSVGTTLENQKA